MIAGFSPTTPTESSIHRASYYRKVVGAAFDQCMLVKLVKTKMRQVPTLSIPNGALDIRDKTDEYVVSESSGQKGFHSANATPTHANKKTVFLDDEERQDESLREVESQQQSQDELEYEILYKEIDRIDQKFQSGADESEEKITLTSTFSKDAEISQTMHEKLMRLIKAMIPNSTNEQKHSFIRDLFEMGLRVGSSSSTRLEIEKSASVEKQAQPSVDEMMIGESNSILDSSNDDSKRQKPNRTTSTYNETMDAGLKNTPSLDEYIDGANSILASTDEYDTPGVELANSVHASISSRRYIAFQATNSSDAVDARWEQLRNKVLNDSNSGRSKNSLTSDMEANLIQECVETGLSPDQTNDTFNVTRQQEQIYENQNGLQKSISNESSSLDHTRPGVYQLNVAQNVRTRPGQADDSSTRQPVHQRNISCDTFSIDAMSQATSHNGYMVKTNVPSFDEGPIARVEAIPFEDANIVNSQDMNEVEGETSSSAVQRTHTITLDPSLKDHHLMIGVSQSGYSDMVNSKGEKISDANTVVRQNQSVDDSSRNMTKSRKNENNSLVPNESLDFDSSHNVANLIYVQSSLTGITDTASPRKEASRSFYRSINLSASETFENNDDIDESPESTTEIQPSWRLSPDKSLSDFMLTVLSSETGTAKNYHVHKHMMAVGQRSSQYMNDVFASENTSHFQVTLDEKTSVLIPDILDFIYCNNHDVTMTTENAVAFRQLAKMLKIWPLEVMSANFILNDMRIDNLVTYVTECSYFNDIEVMKAVVEMCTANIESIAVDDRLWIVMEPELFHQIISSPHIDRGSLSKHLSILLKEYLDLHQYEIASDLFVTLTSDNIIPIVDRSAALPLIELSDAYSSDECEELQKRCAFTIACYWQTTPQAERHRLFALMRHLSSSITVDFLEIVESGHSTLEMLRSEMEQQTIGGNQYEGKKQEPMTIHDFCGRLVDENHRSEKLSWRMDREKSYSDMSIRVEYLNHEGYQMYHVHKHIVAVGPHKSKFLAKHLNSSGATSREKVCIVIKLDFEGSSVVPQILDFLYSQDTELEISNENSVALHYVTRAFEMSTLSKEIMKFIDHNLSFENITDYIIDGGYYRDHATIATAGRLCAREITSIDADSNLLKELEPDFFEKVVSCDVIEKSARSHVNILIMRYFSIRNLEHDVIENLLQSIDIDEIYKDSALDVLKTAIKLKDCEGVETFENMKKRSITVITEHWRDLTLDDDRRQELFSLLPYFPSALVVGIFDTVDSRSREEVRETDMKQAMLEKRYQEQVSEANRLRQDEVSRLKRELETQTATMLRLQKELDGRLFQVERAPVRPTASNGAVIPKSPRKNMKERARESEDGWYPQGGRNDIYGEMDEVEGMEMIADVFIGAEASEKISEASEHKNNNDNYQLNSANSKNEGSRDDPNSDQQSVSTAQVQKKKGRGCCC